MSNEFNLTAELRSDVGKGASRRLRRLDDKVPAVIYGAEKDATSIMLEHRYVIKALENEAFYSHILELDVAGSKEKVVLKDLQRHPAKARILHMDFLRVSAKEKLTMQVPLHLIGEDVAVGVKQEGGIVSQIMNSVEVTCLPADLPEHIDIDISELHLGDSVHLSQLKLPRGVALTADVSEADHDGAVVSIIKPRAQAAADSDDAEGDTEADSESKEDNAE